MKQLNNTFIDNLYLYWKYKSLIMSIDHYNNNKITFKKPLK